MSEAFKLLGTIEVDSLVGKINKIIEKGWESYCYDPGPPWNDMNKIQSLDMIFLFTYPEKDNIIMQNMIVNEELLELFDEDIKLINTIYNNHYPKQEPKRITLSNMRAHSVIPPHVDYKYHYENTTRVHIPIITNRNVVFTFPSVDKTLHMKAGEVTLFNNNILHSGVNDSDENRIHLIIDYAGDEYI